MSELENNIYNIKNEEDLESVFSEILASNPEIRLFALYGELGSGKTRLVKAFCELFKVNDMASSPSFSIINEYGFRDEKIFHIDLYRLKSIDEALNIGIEEYLDSSFYCFIEWPQLIEPILPDNHLKLQLEITGRSSRIIRII